MSFIGNLALILLVSMPPQRPMPIDPPLFSTELGLTEAQLDSISTIRYLTKKELIPLQSELRMKNLELRHEMEKDEPNERKIMRLADEIAQIKAQIRKKNLIKTLNVRKVLTPEQRRKLKELRMKRRPRHAKPRMRGPRWR